MAPLLLATITIVAFGVAGLFSLEALEERRASADAVDLRAATLTLASADALIGTPLESSAVDLESSIATVEGDHTDALHSLTPAEADRVQMLLMGLGTMGHSEMHSADQHSELQTLLDKAARQSKVDAAEAERRAVASAAVALALMLVAILTAARTRQRAERDLLMAQSEAASRARLETLLDDLPDLLVVFDTNGRVSYRTATVARLFGDDATIETFVDCVDTSERDSLRAHLRAAPDTALLVEMETVDGPAFFDIRANDLVDDEFVNGLVVTARDVTAELNLRAELERRASLDALTGLANRRALDRVLDEAKSRAAGQPVGLLLIDFDDFKDVNDTLGHLVGDQLLKAASNRLLDVLRPSETLLRLGGDEFAIVIAPVDAEVINAIATRVRDALATPFEFEEATERVRTSIGAVTLESFSDADELLGKADIALYEAKRAGGDRLVVFESAMEARAIDDARMARALRSVDPDAEFELHYQPIVDASSGHVVSIEALLRWTSPTIGPVSPARFIPIAERLGLMPTIGAWVIDEVCRQIAEWERLGLAEHVTVACNVSAQQLAEAGFVRSVFEAASGWDVRPTRLVVEVTESMFIDHDSVIIDRLAQLRRGGISVAIDDFGSGYSNLGQLLGVPLDTIKIDRELLLRLAEMRDRAGGDPSDPCAIMQAIVTIATMLQAPVVCEGVETPEQRASLTASGVSYLQGYLLGRPGPAADVAFPVAGERGGIDSTALDHSPAALMS